VLRKLFLNYEYKCFYIDVYILVGNHVRIYEKSDKRVKKNVENICCI